jgi:hypothetical protein
MSDGATVLGAATCFGARGRGVEAAPVRDAVAVVETAGAAVSGAPGEAADGAVALAATAGVFFSTAVIRASCSAVGSATS